MSERDTKVVEVEEKLRDMTECSICSETFKDPKILSCVHTFCRTCLEKYGRQLGKKAGEQVACPICRKQFTIPDGGFTGLAKNFFMESLVEMSDSLKPISLKPNVCEVCMEDRGSDNEAELPSAQMLCVDCNQKLCIGCHKRHTEGKLSRNHRTVSLECHKEVSKSSMDNGNSEFCDTHPGKPLEIYCSNCKDVVCTTCFFESHKSHVVSSLDSAVQMFQKQIIEKFEVLLSTAIDVEIAKEKLLVSKTEFVARVFDLRNEIIQTRDELIGKVHKHSDSLFMELEKQRVNAIEKGECDGNGIETLLVSLDSFKTNFTQVMSIGSASSICRAGQILISRAEELNQLCTQYTQNSVELPHLWLMKPNFELILRQQGGNIVGKLTDSAEMSDVGIEHQQTANLDDSYDGCCKMGNEDDRQLGLEETKLMQENETLRLNEVQLKDTIADMTKQIALLQGVIHGGNATTKSEGNVNLAAGLQYHTTIVPLASKDNDAWRIRGIGILDNELFISSHSNVIEVNDLQTLKFKRRWKLENLYIVHHMTHSPGNKSLLFLNETSSKRIEILRVDCNGNLLASWPVSSQGQLSSTADSTVLFLGRAKSQVEEFSPDGKLIHVIPLTWNSGIAHPLHAIKLTSNHFLVSHGSGKDPLHRLCLIDTSGDVLGYAGKEFDREALNCPVYLERYTDEEVLVADHENCRLLVLNPSTLETVSIYQCGSRLGKHSSQLRIKPIIIASDPTNSRVFVVEKQSKFIVSSAGIKETTGVEILSVLTINEKLTDSLCFDKSV